MNGVYKIDQNGHKYITVLFLQLSTNLKLLSNNNNFLHTYIPLNKEYKRDMIKFDIVLALVQGENAIKPIMETTDKKRNIHCRVDKNKTS